MLGIYTKSQVEGVGKKVHWFHTSWFDITVTHLTPAVMSDPSSEPYDVILAMEGDGQKEFGTKKGLLPVSVIVAIH
jgi:hypothetical protein